MALVTFGEGWHNNHHAHAQSARHGFRWWEIDINWYCIKTLGLLGLARDIKLPRPEILKGEDVPAQPLGAQQIPIVVRSSES